MKEETKCYCIDRVPTSHITAKITAVIISLKTKRDYIRLKM